MTYNLFKNLKSFFDLWHNLRLPSVLITLLLTLCFSASCQARGHWEISYKVGGYTVSGDKGTPTVTTISTQTLFNAGSPYWAGTLAPGADMVAHPGTHPYYGSGINLGSGYYTNGYVADSWHIVRKIVLYVTPILTWVPREVGGPNYVPLEDAPTYVTVYVSSHAEAGPPMPEPTSVYASNGWGGAPTNPYPNSPFVVSDNTRMVTRRVGTGGNVRLDTLVLRSGFDSSFGTGPLTPTHLGHAQASVSIRPITFEINATPSTPSFLVTRNLRDLKEIDAYTTWRASMVFDENGDPKPVPFLAGVADFSANAFHYPNGPRAAPVFEQQQYRWNTIPPIYVPVVPALPPGETPQRYIEQGIPLYYSWKPDWADSFAVQLDLALRGAATPAEWSLAPSQSGKTFHWDLGTDLENFPKTTTTHIGITGLQAGDPIIPAKVKIKWYLPPQSSYEVYIPNLEWQVSGENADDFNLQEFNRTLNANAKLKQDMKSWAIREGAIEIVAAGAVAGGGHIVKLVLNSRRSAAVVANKVEDSLNNALAEARAAHNPAGSRPGIRVRAEAREVRLNRGANGETEFVEGAVTKRVNGNTPAAQAEATPVTRRIGDCSTVNTLCFIAGTPVVLGDGTSKPIEQLQVGDIVLSREEATGRTAPRRVQDTLTYQADQTLVLHFDNGSIIETTANHPFYVEHKGFVPAGSLAIGNSIVTRAGPGAVVQAINVKTQASKVYNLTIEDFHTFFVGKAQNALWVHNAGDGGCLSDMPEDHDADATGSFDDPANLPSTSRRLNQPGLDDEIIEGIIELEGKNGVRYKVDKPNTNGTQQINVDHHTVATARIQAEDGVVEKLDPSVSANRATHNNPPINPRSFRSSEDFATYDKGKLLSTSPKSPADLEAQYPEVAERILPVAGDTHLRIRDAEIPLILKFIDRLKADPLRKGTLRIVVSHSGGPCESCRNVIRWFNRQSEYAHRAKIEIYTNRGEPFDGMTGAVKKRSLVDDSITVT